MSVFGFESSKSIRDLLCSLVLALMPFQSSIDQSDFLGEGCGTSCLQYEQDGPKQLIAFLRIGATMLILFESDTFVLIVLNLLVCGVKSMVSA